MLATYKWSFFFFFLSVSDLGVILDNCDPSDMDAGKQTPVLWEKKEAFLTNEPPLQSLFLALLDRILPLHLSLSWNTLSTCPSLLGAEITGMHHCVPMLSLASFSK